jgi:hypothetical protein
MSRDLFVIPLITAQVAEIFHEQSELLEEFAMLLDRGCGFHGLFGNVGDVAPHRSRADCADDQA